MGNVVDYWRLTKPRVTLAIFLLFFLAVLAGGGGYSWLSKAEQLRKMILGSMIVLTAVSGSNALNNRMDYDIDGIMGRTKNREIPSGRISAKAAQYFGLSFITISAVLALVLGDYFPTLLLIGLASYLLMYTLALKRTSVLNVLGVAPAVASPVWIGWILGKGYLDLAGFLTGVLVMIWGPLHLWSLASVYSEDYRSAAIPMLPSIIGVRRSCWYILTSAMVLSIGSLSLFFLGYYGLIYFVGVALASTVLVTFSIMTVARPSGRRNWIMYKFSAPYMVIVLLFAAMDRFLVA